MQSYMVYSAESGFFDLEPKSASFPKQQPFTRGGVRTHNPTLPPLFRDSVPDIDYAPRSGVAGMEHKARDDGFVYGDAPRCPRCGAVLCIKPLTFEDEPGNLILFDCPRSDFHATATKEDIIVAVTAAVKERLRFG